VSVSDAQRVFDGSPFEAVASYCRAIRVHDLVIVSGTAAIGVDGQILHPGDASAQLRIALERALTAAEKLGATRNDVIQTRLYFTPEAAWQEAVRVHGEVFADAKPANTTVLVAGLPPEGALVEVELQAWAPSR
jgi:enamine deaminase RidA (YjgF/YER057c/UK114 family)